MNTWRSGFIPATANKGGIRKIEIRFVRHDYNPRESLFYENLQKICFRKYQPGSIARVGGVLVSGAVVARALMGWQRKAVAL